MQATVMSLLAACFYYWQRLLPSIGSASCRSANTIDPATLVDLTKAGREMRRVITKTPFGHTVRNVPQCVVCRVAFPAQVDSMKHATTLAKTSPRS